MNANYLYNCSFNSVASSHSHSPQPAYIYYLDNHNEV